MTNINEIEICLNCPEFPSECIADDRGCSHLETTTSVREIERFKKQAELSAINSLLARYNYSLTTKVIVDILGIGRDRIDLLKRRGLIKTTKVHNGRGGLRITAINE